MINRASRPQMLVSIPVLAVLTPVRVRVVFNKTKFLKYISDASTCIREHTPTSKRNHNPDV